MQYIDVISEKEKELILIDFNNTAAEYPEDKTIHQLFEDTGGANPGPYLRCRRQPPRDPSCPWSKSNNLPSIE